MKKIIAALAVVLSAHSANAVILDFYAGASAGMGRNISYYPGVNGDSSSHATAQAQNLGVALGLDIPIVRLEGEYNYLSSKRADLHAIMANLYLKLLPTPIIKPYLGIGVGMITGGKVKGGDEKYDAESAQALQGMLGLQIDIPVSPLTVDIEWRTLYADGIYSFPGGQTVGFLQSDIRAKLRYTF